MVHPPSQPAVTAQSFGSGSSGNALLVRTLEHALLIDCGVGIRALRAGLQHHGLTPADLDAVLVTHEHRDHIQTLPKILRDDLPLVATAGTVEAAGLPRDRTMTVTAQRLADLAGATVHPLTVRHDASDPCGFLIEIAGAHITVLTDLGSWETHLAEAVVASDLVLLEANYNDTMLRHGPYPAHLKRRVASRTGHLANDACGAAIAPLVKQRGDSITWWLSHLSATNNSARQAEHDVRQALQRANSDTRITALPRRAPGPVWTFQAPLVTEPGHTISLTGPATQPGIPGLGVDMRSMPANRNPKQ